MPDFSRRSTQAELMDSESVSYEEFYDCLRDLEKINHYTLAYRPTLQWLKKALSKLPSDVCPTLIDAGCGGGDMLRYIRRWANEQNRPMRLIGLDLHPHAQCVAKARTDDALQIEYVSEDIFAYQPDGPVHFIINSLFTHHLSDAAIVKLLQWMNKTASCGWFVNDLHRHPIAYYGIKYPVRLLRLNRLVQHDAPVSVARAFIADEWRHLVQLADITDSECQIRWHFPFRYCVSGAKR